MSERRVLLRDLSLSVIFVGCLLGAAVVAPQRLPAAAAPLLHAAPQPPAPGAPQAPADRKSVV